MKLLNRIEKDLLYKYMGTAFICTSIILTIISFSSAFVLSSQQISYFDNENIDVESISVNMRDGITIKGLIYVDKDLKENTTNSIPTILLLHGINGRKEHKLSIAYQYVKLGFAVISVEQRGHGESGSPSSFLSKEPYDMIQVIDFIENNYAFANTSHIAVLGYSYGGGIGAILQAIEDRVNAVVLYHPLSSLESLIQKIPFQNLIGTTTQVSDIEDIQDAFDIANTSNSKNLLLIQGLSDIIINPKVTHDFYNHLNGTNRDDIFLINRTGLTHSGNEEDLDSLRYGIAWFKHFYINKSIDLADLDTEINRINLFDLNFPENNNAESLIIISTILMFIGLSSLVVKYKILPYWNNLPIKKDVDETREGKERYKKMMIYRTCSYLGAALISGLIFSIFNRSLLYGYFIFYPILTIIIMFFFPSELHSSWISEWKGWVKVNLFSSIYSLSIIIIPTIYFIIFYNLVTSLTLDFTIPLFRIDSISYVVIGLGSGIMDYMYLREMKGKHPLILLAIRPMSLLIFLAFVPVSPFPILGGLFSHILFIILMGVIIFYIWKLVIFLSKFYKNSFSMFLLIMLPFVIFYMKVFFRIL
ncbi:MAG: alpha/beta hydrolase [Candidatus Thorarchaeota archaeon]